MGLRACVTLSAATLCICVNFSCSTPYVSDLPASAQCVRRIGSGTIIVTDARVRTPPTAQVESVCVRARTCVRESVG
jgi:hypothetical protein